ncbi:MAG: hypothetical protein AAGD15_01620 [Agrobacterium cavarae]|uniref:hypothetical protein n=1 Tax=Agrobacterium cavarae TaxID=2528239 RepID=UPI0031B191DA
MEQQIQTFKAALDKAAADMGATKSWKSNTSAFQAASVAFHEFLIAGINECGGLADYYINDPNILKTEIQYAFDDGEAAADAKERNTVVHNALRNPESTLNHQQQGIGARA